MRYTQLVSTLLLFGTLSACQQSAERQAPMAPSAQPAPTEAEETSYGNAQGKVAADAAAPPPPPAAFVTAVAGWQAIDSAKIFVRTAELRFRTANALQATLAIESEVARQGGFVIQNNLITNTLSQKTSPISEDSLLEISHLEVHNSVVLRVPWQRLDTTLRAIGRWAEHLDYRRVNARDVGLERLSNQLAEARNQKAAGETPSTPKTDDRRLSLEAQAAADEARLNNLQLADQVRFSTVQVDIYQRPTVQYAHVARDPKLGPYRAGLGTRLWGGMRWGWIFSQDLLVALAYVWPLWLLVAGFLVWRRLRPA